LQDWFDAYLVWLLKDPQARDRAKRKQPRHLVRRPSRVVRAFRKSRISPEPFWSASPRSALPNKSNPTAANPGELARTQAWNYSVFNLEALINAAAMADKLGLTYGTTNPTTNAVSAKPSIG
jgi:hypothetical protein